MDALNGPVITEADQLRMLLELSRLMGSQLELKPLFEEAVRLTRRIILADRSSLWIYDEVHDAIFTLVGEGLAEAIRLPLGQGVAGVAAERREVLVVNDAYQSPLFDPQWDKKSGYRTRSLLVIPLETRDGRLLGCLQAVNRLDPREPDGFGIFTPADVELFHSIAGVVGMSVENAMLYEEQKRQFNSFIVTLAQSVDARDATTSNHTRLVTGIAVAVARELGLTAQRVERVRIAAVLHDYGKIGVPDALLNKPSRHDPEERLIMKSHCLKTILILSRIAFRRDLRDIPRIAGMHHETLDGTGYPFGLTGDELPLEGRILAVADIFQAFTQTRPYKQGMPPQVALERCREWTRDHVDERFGSLNGPHLDANVVEALARVLSQTGYDLGHFERESGWERMLAGELM